MVANAQKIIATLNARGRERLGKIFPESKVPLRSSEALITVLGGIKDAYYFVDYNQLTFDQRRLLRNYMRAERGFDDLKFDACLQHSPGGQGTIPLPVFAVDTVYEIGAVVDPSRLKDIK